MPIQQGANLASLDLESNETFEEKMMQEDEIEHYEDVLGLEPGEAEEEVIELDDGSVVINYRPKVARSRTQSFTRTWPRA